MKLHLRVVPVRGATFRALTLRPSLKARFSSNFFHDTWHILGDPAGAVARPARPHATDEERREIWAEVDRLLSARG